MYAEQGGSSTSLTESSASFCLSVRIWLLTFFKSSTWWCTKCRGTAVFWETSGLDCLLRHSRWKDDLRPERHTMSEWESPYSWKIIFLFTCIFSPREVGQRKTLLGDCHPPLLLLSSASPPPSMGVNCLHVSSLYTSLKSAHRHIRGVNKGTQDCRGNLFGVYVCFSCTCQRRVSGRPRGTPCRQRRSHHTSPLSNLHLFGWLADGCHLSQSYKHTNKQAHKPAKQTKKMNINTEHTQKNR